MTSYPDAPGWKTPVPEVLAELFPYGARGEFIGSAVVQPAARCIGQVPSQATGQKHRWLKSDHQAFDAAMRVEGNLPRLHIADELTAEKAQEVSEALLGAVAAYHEALPYDDVELGWLYDRHRELPEAADNHRERLRVLQEMRSEGDNGHEERVLSGRDLANRWWLWRRDLGDYGDNNDRARARQALGEVVQVLLPTEQQVRIAYGDSPPPPTHFLPDPEIVGV